MIEIHANRILCVNLYQREYLLVDYIHYILIFYVVLVIQYMTSSIYILSCELLLK